MKRKTRAMPDLWLLIIVIALVAYGLVMVYSSSFVDAALTQGNHFFYFFQQAKWAGLATLAMGVAIYFPLKWIQKMSIPVYALGVVLLLALYIPGLGVEIKGATRWFNLGFTTFMPSEVVKIGMVMMLAHLFSKLKGQLRKIKDIVLCGLILLIPAGIILLQPDYGTMLILVGTAGVMLIIAGLPWIYTLFAAIVGGGGVAFLALSEDYRRDRVMTFLNPWKDPSGDGYQVIQSLYAIVSGKLTGLGFGQSRQKYGYLPEAMSDFIFAIVVEELGIFGASVLIILYVLFLWRGFRIARNSKDTYGMFLAFGFTTMICLQSLVNMGVATSTIPATGITLPFISAGGTSLAISMVAVGLMLNVSRNITKVQTLAEGKGR